MYIIINLGVIKTDVFKSEKNYKVYTIYYQNNTLYLYVRKFNLFFYYFLS